VQGLRAPWAKIRYSGLKNLHGRDQVLSPLMNRMAHSWGITIWLYMSTLMFPSNISFTVIQQFLMRRKAPLVMRGADMRITLDGKEVSRTEVNLMRKCRWGHGSESCRIDQPLIGWWFSSFRLMSNFLPNPLRNRKEWTSTEFPAEIKYLKSQHRKQKLQGRHNR